MAKLDNIPPVYWLTTPKATDRQQNTLVNFQNHGIIDHTMVYGYDVNDFDMSIVTGPYFNEMKTVEIVISVSHLKMIKKWYEETDAEYGLFFEDDINLETVNYWNFSWDEFINDLPYNWNIIQLVVVKEKMPDDLGLMKKTNRYWSACAYLVTRKYAERLINTYTREDDTYDINVKNDKNAIPYAENIIYFLGEPDAYSVPLFTENVELDSNFFITNDIQEKVKTSNYTSERVVMNWWKTKGKDRSIYQITHFENRYRINRMYLGD